MNDYKHQHFLSKTGLTQSDLPIPLARKMEVFGKKEAKLIELTGDNYQGILTDLNDLDREIYQDLLDELGDKLANNEWPPRQKPAAKERPLEMEPVPTTKATDEDILRQEWEKGKRSGLSIEYLQRIGITRNLAHMEVKVGAFTLKRSSVFRVEFRLLKTD